MELQQELYLLRTAAFQRGFYKQAGLGSILRGGTALAGGLAGKGKGLTALLKNIFKSKPRKDILFDPVRPMSGPVIPRSPALRPELLSTRLPMAPSSGVALENAKALISGGKGLTALDAKSMVNLQQRALENMAAAARGRGGISPGRNFTQAPSGLNYSKGTTMGLPFA